MSHVSIIPIRVVPIICFVSKIAGSEKDRDCRLVLFPTWLVLLVMIGWTVGPSRAAPPTSPLEAAEYGPGELLGLLRSPPFHESSGIAASRIRSGILWTHNDSGSKPILYAIDESCRLVTECRVHGARAVDWEDMASFHMDGKPYLLVGDIGNNLKRKRSAELLLIPEVEMPTTSLQVERTVSFLFENGAFDCESLGFDPHSRCVLLVTKTWSPFSGVYQLAWPEVDDDSVQTAKKIANLSLGGITGMDVSPDGRRAILVSYTDAFEFQRGEGESWKDAFSRPPKKLSMPSREQGETICYGEDGVTLFLTSESVRRPSPLYRVTPTDESSRREGKGLDKHTSSGDRNGLRSRAQISPARRRGTR